MYPVITEHKEGGVNKVGRSGKEEEVDNQVKKG